MQDQLTAPVADTQATATQHSIYEIFREIAVKWRRNWEADLAASGSTNFLRSYHIDAAKMQ